MNKVVDTAEEAIRDVFDGAVVMIGGFGLCGIPENLVRALVRKGTRNLTTISNNVGVDGVGNGLLLAAGQIVHHIGSYVGENKLLEDMVLKGAIKLDLVPQGTFSERIRAGGAGIPAFFTPTGVGTLVAEGKETRDFGGRTYLLEHALGGDFALVKAWRGDPLGNLVYRDTARLDQREIAAERVLEQIRTPAELRRLLALSDRRADAGRGVERRDPRAGRAHTLRERALRHQLDLELPGEKLRLEDPVLANVGGDHLRDLVVGEQQAQPEVIDAAVIGHDDQLARAQLPQRRDRALRDPAQPKPADDQRRTITDVRDRRRERTHDLTHAHSPGPSKRATLKPSSIGTLTANTASISVRIRSCVPLVWS